MSRFSNWKLSLQEREAAYLAEHTRANKAVRWARNPKHWKHWSWVIFRFLLILSLSYIVLSPIFFMITMSIRLPWDNMDPSVVWVPRNFSFTVIQQTFKAMNFFPSLWNTLKISVFTGCLQVVSTCIIGYGFARFKFPGRNLLFALVLFTLIVPFETIMPGLYLMFFNVGLKGTYFAFWLPAIFGSGIRAGIFVYIYRQFFRGQPPELAEAAVVDGCGYIKTFLKIMLPGATSIVITIFLFALVWQWNDNYLSAFFMDDVKYRTLATALSNLPEELRKLMATNQDASGELGVSDANNQHTMMSIIQCGALVMIFPVLVIYIVLQRYFTESISRSGIVG